MSQDLREMDKLHGLRRRMSVIEKTLATLSKHKVESFG
jgi:hypothetical protein